MLLYNGLTRLQSITTETNEIRGLEESMRIDEWDN